MVAVWSMHLSRVLLGAHASCVQGAGHPGHAGSVRSQGRPPRSLRLCLENTDWGQLVTPLHHHSRATGTVFSCAWVRPWRMGDCGEVFGCGFAALCSSVVSFCAVYEDRLCPGFWRFSFFGLH